MELEGRALGYLLNQAARTIRDATVAAIDQFGIEPIDLGLMQILAADGRMNQRALGDADGRDRTTIVHRVDKLEALGLARRATDPGDRRAYLVELTDHGVDVVNAAGRAAVEVERTWASTLSPTDLEALRSLLARALTSFSG